MTNELGYQHTLLMSRFWGFRSRWSIFLLWQYDRPRNNWNLRKTWLITNLLNNEKFNFNFQNASNQKKQERTYMNDFTTSGSMSPLRESKYFFRSWSQCSNTKVNFLSECRTSCNLTIFRCFNSFNKQISLNAEDGTPCNSGINNDK